MSTILNEDDFEIGMLMMGHSGPNQHFNGKIYKLEAINLPYIALKLQSPDSIFQKSISTLDTIFGESDIVVVDIRCYKFMKVNEQFAKAVLTRGS